MTTLLDAVFDKIGNDGSSVGSEKGEEGVNESDGDINVGDDDNIDGIKEEPDVETVEGKVEEIEEGISVKKNVGNDEGSDVGRTLVKDGEGEDNKTGRNVGTTKDTSVGHLEGTIPGKKEDGSTVTNAEEVKGEKTKLGDREGDPVGSTLGVLVGFGVGLPATYVGDCDGAMLGDDDGWLEGNGVGEPGT